MRRARASKTVGPTVRSIEGIVGPADRWYQHELTTRFVGLDQLKAHCPPSDEAPVLILGAGWRSGTTLLQRMIVSTNETLVWGEPWNRSQPTRSLVAQGRAISDEWLGILPSISPQDRDLDHSWIANLFPGIEHLLRAQQRYLLTLFRDPAHAAGYGNWGIKEVRLAGADLRYLTMLFPRSRALVVHRDPRDAWASYRAMGLQSYRRWPGHRVDTVRRFARNWADLATSLSAAAGPCDALVLRYDRLHDEETLAAIEAHVGSTIDRSVVDDHVGGSKNVAALNVYERRTIQRVAGPVMERLGYA